MFIVRRKDPPAYEGVATYWQTVARRKTLSDARAAMSILRGLAKSNVAWWCGEETDPMYGKQPEYK